MPSKTPKEGSLSPEFVVDKVLRDLDQMLKTKTKATVKKLHEEMAEAVKKAADDLKAHLATWAK